MKSKPDKSMSIKDQPIVRRQERHKKQCDCSSDFTLVNRGDLSAANDFIRIKPGAIWKCAECGRTAKIVSQVRTKDEYSLSCRLTRQEYLNWCKQKALEHLEQGDTKNALTSMFSNLRKHPETANHSAIELGGGHLKTIDEVRKFIEDFN
jgi:hypothetical protein